MLEVKAKNQEHRRVFTKKRPLKFFSGVLQKIEIKKGLQKHFSGNLQNFNDSKNSAVLEPRTGQFSRTWGFEATDLTFEAMNLTFEAKAKDFKMCPRGLHLWLVTNTTIKLFQSNFDTSMQNRMMMIVLTAIYVPNAQLHNH